MKWLIYISFLCSVFVNYSWGQITAAEYFIDTDPGVGNATALTISSGNTIDETFSISTTGQPEGLHVLHIRVKDNNDVWSLFFRDYFYVQDGTTPPTPKPITAAEYFVDNDPGVGSGTALSISAGNTINETFSITTTALASGLHVLHIRTRDDDGTWSLYFRNYYSHQEKPSVTMPNMNLLHVIANEINGIFHKEI